MKVELTDADALAERLAVHMAAGAVALAELSARDDGDEEPPGDVVDADIVPEPILTQ